MKILVTGVSSGIGRELSKKLIKEGHFVWGISRKRLLLNSLKKELPNTHKITLSKLDLNQPKVWDKLILKMKKQKFTPEVIVFNAAIYQNDLDKHINIMQTRLMLETNFFSILEGLNTLINYLPKARFIAVSSSSALKGNGSEGVGYSVSKAALTLAFESLRQKFNKKFTFAIIFFGPVKTNMSRTPRPFALSAGYAADQIIKIIQNQQIISEHPSWLFLLIKLIKLLPPKISSLIFSRLEKIH